MKKDQLLAVLRDMKRLWAQSLAQVDNTSGRRGIDMQMEAVEEMCDHRINPAIEAMLAEMENASRKAVPAAAVPAGALPLPVVADPRELPARQKRHKSSNRGRNLRLVA